jgi:hypothetical protein|tara:strand:+ start:118 stop:651 length:534 start_codon:yes stop_codon:yes gene_type:complete
MIINGQNDLLLSDIMKYYEKNKNFDSMLKIINGESKISLRIIDWFTTNYAKKHFTIFKNKHDNRFKVYDNYKLKLKAYKKSRFDPFCRWDRIQVPFGDQNLSIETTLGQLNFFKWALENDIIQYIENNYDIIEKDMNNNNTLSKRKYTKTRKKREELSISALRSLKKENIDVVLKFK